MNPMTAKAAAGTNKNKDRSKINSPHKGTCTVLALAVSASIRVNDCTNGSRRFGCGVDGGGMTLFSNDGTISLASFPSSLSSEDGVVESSLSPSAAAKQMRGRFDEWAVCCCTSNARG